jgi:hypothetical protein
MQLNIIFTVEKEINEAKEISFGIVRNLIGVVAFMTFSIIYPFSCVFNEVITR